MRDYSKISSSFWTGKTGRAIRGDRDAQIVALYLLSSPHSNMIGVFQCPLVYIAHETGSPFEGASKGLRRLIEEGFCSYDEDSETVWVHEMARFQIGDDLKSNDNRSKSIQSLFLGIQSSNIQRCFYEKYGTSFHLAEPPQEHSETAPFKAPCKPPSKPLTTPLRSQEKEKEQEKELKPPTGGNAAQQKSEPLSRSASPPAPPSPISTNPETGIDPPEQGTDPPATKPESEFQAHCRSAWSAYREAFFGRYSTEPVRNAKINSQIRQLVQRLGAEEVSHVIRFFVQHNAAYYVRQCHSLGALLADAEKLRTEWATGRMVTATSARQIDRTQTNRNSAQEAIEILKRKREQKEQEQT